jgi:protein-S-isoprenylcysteine O-methyltransferase Ste14
LAVQKGVNDEPHTRILFGHWHTGAGDPVNYAGRYDASQLNGFVSLHLWSHLSLQVLIVYWFRRIEFWRPRARGGMISEERSDWSFWFVVVGMVAAFYLPPLEYLLFEGILPRTFFMQLLGLPLIVLGSALFIWARRTLGQFYSGHVSVIEGQPLVQNGPYHFIRHPAYTGYLLIALGIALGYSSLAGLVAIVTLLLPGLLYRMNVEEKLLFEHFGEVYRQYGNRTKRLIPGIW